MSAKVAPQMPDSHLIAGLFFDFQRDPLDLLERARTYGDVVRMRFAYKQNYVMNHPDAVQEVLVKQANKFRKDDFIRNAFEPFIGNGLTISEGDHWKKQRKLLAPAFHAQRIRHYAETIIAQTHLLLEKWQTEPNRDLQNDMVYLTTGIVGLTLFGDDASQQSDEISQLLGEVNQLFIERSQQIASLPRWMPTQHNRNLNRVVSAFDEIVHRFIHERQQTMADRGDLLSMLLLSEDENGNRMSPQEVRDEAVTIFLAGNDTTASALTWMLYALTQHPDVLDKIRHEVEAIAPSRDLSFDDLRDLSYLNAVIDEVQRLYPVTWAFSRECITDCEIMGYHIPAKSIITLPSYSIHRDPTWWDEPLTFKPERFIGEHQRPKYSYFPFGGGRRVCIGSNLALMEIRLVVATIVRHMDIVYTNDDPLKPNPMMVMQPNQRVQMHVTQREIIMQ
ncbi:MAG: cytochrome P450 [Chloroflexota bacterium]